MSSRLHSRAPGSARLFAGSGSSAPPANVFTANIDGASRGNPGPASYALVVRDPSGKIVLEHAKNIGRETNNVAEYYALLAALDYAIAHGVSALRVRSDSELLVRQMQGRYKVKSPDLRPLHERASKLVRQLTYFQIEHVRRELNRDADALANVALDEAGASRSETQNLHEREPRAASQPKQQVVAMDQQLRANPLSSRAIRARFERGVFVPTEPLNLEDGSQVEMRIRILKK